MSKIKQNTLRDRSEKLPAITDEMLQEILPDHKELFDNYFEDNSQLSAQSLKQYKSGMKQWFWWIHIKLKDKPMWEITKRDYLKYRNFLYNHGLSSNAIKFKQSSVSTLCNYIENIFVEEDKRYESFRNFTRGLPALPNNKVYDKIKVTREEYEFLIDELSQREDYLGMAWLATAFNCGCRRSEIVQFKTEILDYPIEENKNYILSHKIRLKGKGLDGKQEEYMINLEALKYMKLWVEKRGYESEWIFTNRNGDQILPEWGNNFCTNVLSVLLERRINCHIFKASCITNLLEQGVDLALVSKYVAHHNDVSTTLGFYDLRDFEEEKSKIF